MSASRTTENPCIISRRKVLAGGMSGILITSLPLRASASQKDMDAAVLKTFGNQIAQTGRVTLSIPPIAENGYSVPLSISVDSPMSQTDYVKRIVVFAPANPIPQVSSFTLTPRSGKAEVSTRIRLAGTQTVMAFAEMSDGTLWSGGAQTVVTLAACVIL